MVKPDLTVVPGGWVTAPMWAQLPDTIRARSPFNRSAQCRVRVAKGDVEKAGQARRRQPAYEFASILNGRRPEVPWDAETEAEAPATLMTLFDAHACFRGVRRPIGNDPTGYQTVVYVLKPAQFFAYGTGQGSRFAILSEPRPEAVFVAYVRLDVPQDDAASIGVLSHWHFVKADQADLMLPAGFAERYEERLW